MEEFNLKKLSELKVREQYQVKISNRLVALENLNDDVDIISAWEVLYRMWEIIIKWNSRNHASVRNAQMSYRRK